MSSLQNSNKPKTFCGIHCLHVCLSHGTVSMGFTPSTPIDIIPIQNGYERVNGQAQCYSMEFTLKHKKTAEAIGLQDDLRL